MFVIFILSLCFTVSLLPVRFGVLGSDDVVIPPRLPPHVKFSWDRGATAADNNPYYRVSLDRPTYEKNDEGKIETRGVVRTLLSSSDYSAASADVESESLSPSISFPILSSPTSPSLNISKIGEHCNLALQPHINGGCQIGLVCNANNICVGPAATGGNCNTTNSNYVCENGNWCHCNHALFGDACYCTAEAQDGAPCTYDYQCRGRSGCNRGVCTKLYSVEKGDASSSFYYCRPGLLYDSVSETCVNPDKKPCATQLDCAPGWAGVTDNILYECRNNKCHYEGPNCWSYLPETSAYLNYNNYYDETRERIPFSTWEMYAWCVYESYHAKGASPSSIELFRQSTNYNGIYFTNVQTKWVDTGGNCTDPSTRCKMGSYCANHVCVLFPGPGDDCGLFPGALNANGSYYMCDVTEFYQCDRYSVDAYTSAYAGSLGKCVTGTSKNGGLCSSNFTTYNGVAVYDLNVCNWDKGYYCNFDHNVGEYYTGHCAKPASIGSGLTASDDYFCANGLAFGYFGHLWPQCMSLQNTPVNCTSWLDCLDFDLSAVGQWYDDYHYVYEPYEYGWSYLEYYRRQVECRVGKCYFINPTSCQKQLDKAVDYTRADNDYPNNCPYLECQLVNDTTPKYKYCANSASSGTYPSTFIAAIALTIAGLLFF